MSLGSVGVRRFITGFRIGRSSGEQDAIQELVGNAHCVQRLGYLLGYSVRVHLWREHLVPQSIRTVCVPKFLDAFSLASCLMQALTKNLIRSGPTPPFGFGDDQISIYAEIPDMVVPCKSSLLFSCWHSNCKLTKSCLVGEAAYNSTITLHSEVLPVSVDLMGKPPGFFSSLKTFSRIVRFPRMAGSVDHDLRRAT